jgi:hypothetical protein
VNPRRIGDRLVYRLNRLKDISVSLRRPKSDTSFTVIYHAMSLTILYIVIIISSTCGVYITDKNQILSVVLGGAMS